MIAARDDFEEQIGVARVVGEIPQLVNGEQCRATVVTQAALQGGGRVLGGEVVESRKRRFAGMGR